MKETYPSLSGRAVAAYLSTFFDALAALADTQLGDVPNQISYRDGILEVLVSMGDVWARVPVQELDADPSQAAQDVVRRWKAMSPSEIHVTEGR